MEKEIGYFAVLEYSRDGIAVHFPDLPGCFSCGYTTREAKIMAADALKLYLKDIKEYPKASKKEELEVEKTSLKRICFIRLK